MRFDPEYVSQVLTENFEDAKTLFLSPLMAIHYAHLVMLVDRGIVSREDGRRLRDALDGISLDAVKCTAYDGTCEDLFFYVERLVSSACGPDIAGRLHTARSRNDIDMTMYRMRQRDSIALLIESVLDLRASLLALAADHHETVFAAHTHTQPAQPTTIAHYLLAVIEQLERDVVRLEASYASTNRSPLGACAITGTGFPIDRDLTSSLLGFDAPTGNTYGSIATVDYLLESVSATAVLCAGLGRVLQDLLTWCTAELGYLRLSDGFVQTSSIMPQKRNPVALEHARGIASKAVGQASAVMMAVHNTPFGDIVDVEDDLQPLVAAAFRDARRAVALTAAALRDAQFDVSRLEARAAEGGTTLTELADHLVRTHGIAFGAAHAVASRMLAEWRQAQASSSATPAPTSSASPSTLPPVTPATPLAPILARVSAEVLGQSLDYSEADLAQVLSARHFVDVRSTPGGPAPQETRRALRHSQQQLETDRAWLAARRAQTTAAESRLRERSRAL